MTRNVRARYENGVLRPLERIDLPEGETVDVALSPAGWAERMRALLAQVWERTRHLAPEEIEAEISRASQELRGERVVPG